MPTSPVPLGFAQPAQAAERPAAQAATTPARTVASEELLRGGRTVEISHNGLIYRLQATRLGKLILTK